MTFRRVWATIVPVVLFWLGLTGPAPAAPADYLHFSVIRNGQKIGHHRIDFYQEGTRTRVAIDVDVRVRVAFVTVYRFLHRATEVWENGRLLSLESATDNDGEHHRLSVRRSGELLAVDLDGKTWSVHGNAIPTSLWDPRVLSRTSLLSG